MEKNNFSDLGDTIKNIVQDAVDTMDFHRLNQGIGETIDSALDEVRNALGINQTQQWNKQEPEKYIDENSRHKRQKANYAYQAQKDIRTMHQPPNRRTNVVKRKDVPMLISNKPAGRVSGILCMTFGFLGTGLFGITILTLMMISMMSGAYFPANVLIVYLFLPLFCISLLISGRGVQLRKRIQRFRSYVGQLHGRSYCTIKELAGSAGKNKKYVVKDLRKMIQLKMFPEGYIDEQETHLMLSYQTYKQYQQAQESLRKRQQEELMQKEQKQEKEGEQQRLEQKQSIIDEGRTYINQIKEANRLIKGQEISDKLDCLENVIVKIFDYVGRHPEQLEDIHRFMEYYLPTTLKLVNAYQEFDAQAIQGTNISSAKKEIVKTLDTINLAFANLLDSLFQDAAMDISTDISVLETMLAQEGLTESEFKNKEQ